MNVRAFMTAAPEDCPVGWTPVTVCDLGEIVSGGTPDRSNPRYWGGDIPWVTPTEITALREKWLDNTAEKITAAGLAGSGARLLPPGSILVTTRASLGGVAIARVQLTTNQGFKSIVPNAHTESLFCYYAIQSLRSEMARLAVGTTFPEISKQDFSRIRLNRPPRPEQVRIAEILDTLDAAIKQTTTIVDKLCQIKKGLIDDLLTRGLDELGYMRNAAVHPGQFQQCATNLVPAEWKPTTLGELISENGGFLQTGPFGSQLHSAEYTEEGVAVIMPQNMQADGTIDYGTAAKISESRASLLARHRLRSGDVLFARRGDLSRCCVIRDGVVAICGTGCLLFRPPRDVVLPDWFVAVYRHDDCQKQIACRAVGTTMVNLNTQVLSDLLLYVPDIKEQERIAGRLDDIESRIAAERQMLSKLQWVKSGVSCDLLSGNVRTRV
jgi:type I restriction enzyme S subunit